VLDYTFAIVISNFRQEPSSLYTFNFSFMNSRYNKEMLEAVVKECYSISQVLTKLNLRPSGGKSFNRSAYLIVFKVWSAWE
jgi:hypothetical protein